MGIMPVSLATKAKTLLAVGAVGATSLAHSGCVMVRHGRHTHIVPVIPPPVVVVPAPPPPVIIYPYVPYYRPYYHHHHR